MVINAGTSSVCIEVEAIEDGIYELSEVFALIFTSSDSAVDNIFVSETLVTVIDLDEGTMNLQGLVTIGPGPGLVAIGLRPGPGPAG